MTYAETQPMQILAAIQSKDQDTLVSATNIRGERKTIREKQLGRRTSIEALLDNLSTPDWTSAAKKHSKNHVQNSLYPSCVTILEESITPDFTVLEKNVEQLY